MLVRWGEGMGAGGNWQSSGSLLLLLLHRISMMIVVLLLLVLLCYLSVPSVLALLFFPAPPLLLTCQQGHSPPSQPGAVHAGVALTVPLMPILQRLGK